MSNWTGKITGFLLGLVFGGPIFAILGLFVGHVFDTGPESLGNLAGMSTQKRYIIQQAYFKTTFMVMGHIAKADGRVSEDEIRTARNIMKNMNLNQTQRREAIHLFTQGKQSDFKLADALQELFQACGPNQPMLYRMFIDIQFRAAAAEGKIGPNKQAILKNICQFFSFPYQDFATFYQQHGAHNYQQSQSHQQTHQRGHQRRTTSTSTRSSALNNAYTLLGAKSTQTDAEIKKAYRVKMSQNHPDKLISKGLPEEMIKLANQKTTEIKKAYDTIMKARGKK